MDLGEILSELVKMIPVPKTFFELAWTGIGWLFAASFAQFNNTDFDTYVEKKLGIKNGEQPISDSTWWKWFGERLLHFVHHWWIGALLMIYFGPVAYYLDMPKIFVPEIFWFGVGAFMEDLQHHIRASARDGLISKIMAIGNRK